MTFIAPNSNTVTMTSTSEDICRLKLKLSSPKKTMEVALTRAEVIQFYNDLNKPDQRFVNVSGTGIPIDRIDSYEEEDMNGKSVITEILKYPTFTFSGSFDITRDKGIAGMHKDTGMNKHAAPLGDVTPVGEFIDPRNTFQTY